MKVSLQCTKIDHLHCKRIHWTRKGPCPIDRKKLKVAGKSKGRFKKKGKKTKKNKSQNSRTKSKGNCFHCNKLRYWKRNCHKYLEELKAKKKGKGKYDLLVLETFLVKSDIST